MQLVSLLLFVFALVLASTAAPIQTGAANQVAPAQASSPAVTKASVSTVESSVKAQGTDVFSPLDTSVPGPIEEEADPRPNAGHGCIIA
ncbi:hypothetical protein DFH07DRAFT_423808 [Mycena maculata]|uniref:Uncharacterized protein n=1 Tax=Mycena maculata TaxID=230809 RepID=A0AAD7NHS8_9AGAR|nr:hypothetical protein DFH07DRAFT_423808 [Mycena maculata]